MSVVVTIDARKYPMEIAKSMLSLGNDLNMNTGVAGYYEAYNRLQVFLESLTVYHSVLWPSITMDFMKQKRAVERFLTLHRNNPNLAESQARQLLDFMHFFPVAGDDNGQ